jgi:hypothetical protein
VGGYQRPSDASHQSGPCDVSLNYVPIVLPCARGLNSNAWSHPPVRRHQGGVPNDLLQSSRVDLDPWGIGFDFEHQRQLAPGLAAIVTAGDAGNGGRRP